MNCRCSLQPTPCRSWIGETSPNPDFVRPVDVFQGFFDIAHPCRHDESVVERSTIIQKSFEKINQIFIEKSIRNRQNIRSAPRLREKRIRTRHGGRLRTSQERPRASQEPLRGVLGRPWGRPRTSRERPGALPKRPRSVPGAPPIAPNRPQGAQERFCIDFSSIWGRFGGRFSMVFALNSCSLGRSFVFSFDRVRVLRLLSTFASRAF